VLAAFAKELSKEEGLEFCGSENKQQKIKKK